MLLVTLLSYTLPEVPNNLTTQLLRERQLHKEQQFLKDEPAFTVGESGGGNGSRGGLGDDDDDDSSRSSSKRISLVVAESLRLRTALRKNNLVAGDDMVDITYD
jgi:hypothetical protein